MDAIDTVKLPSRHYHLVGQRWMNLSPSIDYDKFVMTEYNLHIEYFYAILLGVD